MIRVLIVGYSENKGGVEAYITNLCSNMDDKEFEFVYSLPKMVIDGKEWNAPASRHNYFKYHAFWENFFKENKFDVVYYNTCDIVSIDMLKFAKKAGVPVRIIHSHSTNNQYESGGLLGRVHRFSEKNNRKNIDKYATDLFACSKSAGEWMFGAHDYRIIKNGIDLNKYKFNEESSKKCRASIGCKDEILIGAVGRLDHEKNTIYALDVIENIVKRGIYAKLVFIGDGEMRNEIESQIKTRKLEHFVSLTGAVNNVYEWMSAIDCLIMPSLFEGLPFVLVESQAAGVPCVVSTGVSKEANLTGLVHFISLDESVNIWADKILELCEKEREDVSNTLIEKGYSIENTANVVSNIIFERLK